MKVTNRMLRNGDRLVTVEQRFFVEDVIPLENLTQTAEHAESVQDETVSRLKEKLVKEIREQA